jgi:hypothetical protein
MLTGCNSQIYNPVISNEFEADATYTIGDFSYKCNIVKTEQDVSITANSTYAQGLTISCDGKNVTYKRNDMEKSISCDDVDCTNPALILYQVLFSLEDAQVQLVGDEYQYTSKTDAGDYVFIQGKDNSYKSLLISQADIEITFSS